MPGACHKGSFVCDAGHELRITSRCLRADLKYEPPRDFDQLADAHEIVDAFRVKRDVYPDGGKTVGPANGDLTLYRLAKGDDHRGATWFDARVGVVWLCAERFHRSGTANDAFPYFHALIKSRQIWPTREDYEWLELDRAERLAERLPEAAQELLAHARANPNQEHRAVIGQGQVGVVVEIVETLEETYVAFSVASIGDPTRVIALLAAFYPGRDFGEWQYRNRLPTRPLVPGELCRSIFHA